MISNERNGRGFGGYTLVGDKADQNGFFDKDTRGKALDLAWSHACVIAQQLTDPQNETYGPEWMLKRYGETNFWFGYIVHKATQTNQILAAQLKYPVLRREGEPAGNFESESVPTSHMTEISPMGRIFGYALPRVHIEAMYAGGDNKTNIRAMLSIGILDDAIRTCATPSKLLANLARNAVNLGADPKVILSHILPSGVLQEQNCFRDFEMIIGDLRIHASTIWRAYRKLRPDQMEEFGIANI